MEVLGYEGRLGLRTAAKSLLIGMHNPLIHGLFVILSWVKLFRKLPSFFEALCILVHDIGYLQQTTLDGDDNNHPQLGAAMCSLFGEKYWLLCLTHSRDFAKLLGKPLSKLGYADKYSVLLYPDWLFKRLIYLGGEAAEYHRTTKTRKWGYPVDVKLIKASYRRWFRENGETAPEF